MPKETVLADGSFDFAGGVDSQAVTTVRSNLVPHGLRRDQLSWLNNATVRGGGILQRAAWSKLCDLLTGGLYQGGTIYETFDLTSNPRLIVSVSGHIYSILLEPPFTITDLSVKFGLFNPPAIDQVFFVEAEGLLVIQAGDFETASVPTLPLIYRSPFGASPEIMRRSRGLNGNTTIPPNLQEIPGAMCMVYYAGRIWYAQGRIYTAGDIVGNQFSGTAAYNFRDSVTRVTENPLAVGGDGFTVPSQAGNIRALAYTANLDTSLGQGPLYIFTRKQVYSLSVPVSRTDWIAANNTNQPLQTVAQINNGSVSERCIVHSNGDLFYRSLTPDVRSLIVATRYYQQWGNVSISNNVNRAMGFEDRALLRFCSGIEFDNRLLMCCLPKQTESGVVSQGILPLDFDLVSTLQDREPPAWEGIYEGLDILQLFTGDFGGRQRAFAVIKDRLDSTIDVWELSQADRFGSDGKQSDKRVTWQMEFPAFTWGKEFELKQLHGGEIWVDRVFGAVNMEIYFRPDADPCWHLWTRTSFCAARTCTEDVNNPICYPIGPNFREAYRWPIVLPEPPVACDVVGVRQVNIGYQFQTKIVITGFVRIRGLILYAEQKERNLYDGLPC